MQPSAPIVRCVRMGEAVLQQPARGGSLAAPGQSLAFGPFRLFPAARRLERDGIEVPLGGRALDLLACLVAHAGDVVSKAVLCESAWPGLIVEEGSLRFHIAMLRKALGEAEQGRGYLTTVAGRGYCFTGCAPSPPVTAPPPPAAPYYQLPVPLRRVVGGDAMLEETAAELEARRFLTLVGTPGIGKTTLAVRLGHVLAGQFRNGVVFVNLSAVSAPQFLLDAIAAAIGRALPPEHDADDLIAHLADCQMLLILDNCEHLVDPVALLAERLVRALPEISLLATSREALRAEGEAVYQMLPLAFPPAGSEPKAATALAHPAVELFVDRLQTQRLGYVLTDADAPLIADICRKLDGIPLAIELAAMRVPSLGIRQTAEMLADHLSLLWRGRRTAPPRHQTLSAALDWSYDLLSPAERTLLRRLAVFVGSFTLEAATALAGDAQTGAALAGLLTELVAKSLILMQEGQSTSYRLLDTTRVYALAKLMGTPEAVEILRRHAVYYRDKTSQAEAAEALLHAASGAGSFDQIGNLRTALQWSFASGHDDRLAISLAAAAAPVFLDLSLPAESRDWSAKALALLNEDERGSATEMQLQAAHGLALLHMGGRPGMIREAFQRGLEIAQCLGDQYQQLQFFGGLHVSRLRAGDFRGALRAAEQGRDCAAQLALPQALSMADAMLTVAYHFTGQHALCRVHIAAASALAPAAARVRTLQFGYGHRARVQCAIARELWIRGYPLAAAQAAHEAISEAQEAANPMAYATSLAFNGMVFFWNEEWDTAQHYVRRLAAHAREHVFAAYIGVAQALEGVLELHQGRPREAVAKLNHALAVLRRQGFEILSAWLLGALAQAYDQAGFADEALQTIEAAVALVELNGDRLHLPELLCLCGGILLRQQAWDAALASLKQALACARAQGARAWELRAALAQARLLQRRGEPQAAHRLLAVILDEAQPGAHNADHEAARALLDRLSPAS